MYSRYLYLSIQQILNFCDTEVFFAFPKNTLNIILKTLLHFKFKLKKSMILNTKNGAHNFSSALP